MNKELLSDHEKELLHSWLDKMKTILIKGEVTDIEGSLKLMEYAFLQDLQTSNQLKHLKQ